MSDIYRGGPFFEVPWATLPGRAGCGCFSPIPWPHFTGWEVHRLCRKSKVCACLASLHPACSMLAGEQGRGMPGPSLVAAMVARVAQLGLHTLLGWGLPRGRLHDTV